MPDDDLPEDTRLTKTKSRWAELGKFLTGQRTRPKEVRPPPGQHWPVLDLGQTPNVPRESWRLDVAGAVERPPQLELAGLSGAAAEQQAPRHPPRHARGGLRADER